jgi:ribosomal protein L11 methyltransferase
MLVLTARGRLPEIRAAADAFDRLDPSPADAVTWFEEAANLYRLVVHVGAEQDAASARAVIGHAAPHLHVNTEPVRDADWVAMSLEGLPAVTAGRFLVGGAHALARARGGRTRIWIEASEAFGTGHHGSTRGCLIALERILRTRRVRRVLDVGAGSGVLAIAAAKTGAQATAIEIDPRAARIARVNVRQNRVRARVLAGDGARLIAHQRFDLVFANILMRPLIRLAPALAAAIERGGHLVLSGLLRRQAPLVAAAYANRGLILVHRFHAENWATLVWRKPQRP